MEQLKRTVASVAGDKKVYLNVEGKRLVAAAEGLEVQQPINF
jgi:spore germination protein GerM